MNVRTALIYVIVKVALLFLFNVYILDILERKANEYRSSDSIFKPYKQSKQKETTVYNVFNKRDVFSLIGVVASVLIPKFIFPDEYIEVIEAEDEVLVNDEPEE